MKKIFLFSLLFLSIGNTGTIQDFYNEASNNKISSYLERKMETEARACSNGHKVSCVALGVGSITTSLVRLDSLLIDFATRGKTRKQKIAQKRIKNIVKKLNKKRAKSKRVTKSQIIRKAVISGKENLNKTGVYKIIFKQRVYVDKKGLRQVGKYYIGKAEKQTVEGRLKNRTKEWLQSIKSIQVKYFPRNEVDKAERTIIGGATRFEDIYYKKKTSSYRNEPHNRTKHPKGKYFFEKQKNIQGYKILISVRNSKHAYIKINNKKINLIRNEKFRSFAKILSFVPKGIKNNHQLRKELVSARIAWKNLSR